MGAATQGAVAHQELPSCAELRRLGRPAPELPGRPEEELGVNAMLRLVTAVGGQSVTVTSEASAPTSALARLCGQDVALRLAEEIGWGHLRVPLGPASHSNRGLALCVAMSRDGASVAEIVRATGPSRRTIEHRRTTLRRRGVNL
jgi:hypothetical protein